MVRISVIVATYNSLPDLDLLVSSIEAQSLPQDEFELVAVDDGSTDGTFEWLTERQRTMPNLVVDRIPNSGWSGRPRNLGTRLSRGEYVFFADHDDYLFPEALERMHAFATEHDLDVVVPKEVVKGWKQPGWDTWREELPRVEEWTQSLLQCITPHKLYRRAFLDEQDVHFLEGKVRLEDFDFNGKAWARTDAVGMLASYPCYQWIIHESNSHRAGYDHDVYWKSFRDSLDAILALEAGDKKDQLLIRWYRSRILDRVKNLRTYDEAAGERMMGTWADLLPLFPPELDAELHPLHRPRGALLRQGDAAALLELSELDRGLRWRIDRSAVTWVEGRLRVELSAFAGDRHRAPIRVRREGDRVVREVPESLASLVDPGVWDLTDWVRDSFSELAVRSRDTWVDWIVPGKSSVRVVDEEGGPVLRTDLVAEIDPGTAAFGAPLADEVWDVFFRVVGTGVGGGHVSVDDGMPAPALVGGRTAVAYRNKNGHLTLDLSGRGRRFFTAADPGRRQLRPRRDRTVIMLPRVHVAGPVDLPCVLVTDEGRRPARITVHDGRARVVAPGPRPTVGPVSVELGGEVKRLFRIPEPEPGAEPAPAPPAPATAAGERSGRLARRAARRLVRGRRREQGPPKE